MKKIDTILGVLKEMAERVHTIEIIARDKAAQLERALNNAREENARLRGEIEVREKHIEALEGRLSYLFRSETLQLFDEKSRLGCHVRDIKRLDQLCPPHIVRQSDAPHCQTCEWENIGSKLGPCRDCFAFSGWMAKKETTT